MSDLGACYKIVWLIKRKLVQVTRALSLHNLGGDVRQLPAQYRPARGVSGRALSNARHPFQWSPMPADCVQVVADPAGNTFNSKDGK